MAISSVLKNHVGRHYLTVDSKGLFDTIKTLHQCRDYNLKQTVQRIRDSFDSEELDVLR